MVDASLGDRLTLRIDPTWPHRSLWRHPHGDVLRVVYVDFEGGVGESATPNYADTDVYGRAEPYKAFTGTSPKTIELSFTFMVQNGDPYNEVVLPGRFLDALKYPVYSAQQQLSHPPPPCILKIGAFLLARVVLTGGDPEWKGPVDTQTLYPHQCEFRAQFQVVRTFQADLSYRFDGQWQ